MPRFGLILAAMLLTTGTLPASAHALLRKAVPGVGSTLRSAPADMTLIFSEAIELSLCRIALHNAAGADAGPIAVHGVADNASKLVGALPPLAAGIYTVEWHVTSVDAHKTEGRFSFTVAP